MNLAFAWKLPGGNLTAHSDALMIVVVRLGVRAWLGQVRSRVAGPLGLAVDVRMMHWLAPRTTTIRIGSGAVQMGHRTALPAVGEFGLIDALHAR